jgi:hypothetical protein
VVKRFPPFVITLNKLIRLGDFFEILMKNKVWNKTVIATEEQNVEIYPTEEFHGIIIETKELDDTKGSPRLYLNKDEMELLIIKMQEMMNYVLEK